MRWFRVGDDGDRLMDVNQKVSYGERIHVLVHEQQQSSTRAVAAGD